MSSLSHRLPRSLLPGLTCVAVLGGLGRAAVAQERTPVKSADDLPRHTYKIPGKASELVQSDEQFTALAKQVRADVEADLAKYQIDDASTLQRYNNVLMYLDLLEGRYEAALKDIARLRELETKEAEKLMTGVVAEAYIEARKQAGDDEVKVRAVYQTILLATLSPLPWDVVGSDIERRKGQAEMVAQPLLLGVIQNGIDPVIEKTQGELSADIAQRLVTVRFALKFLLPLKAESIAAFQAVIDAHQVAKKDIWAARAVALKEDQKLTPVVVAIWDSGVDTRVFEKQLWSDPQKPDVHGLAFDLDSNPTPDLLHSLAALKAAPAEVAKHIKGFMDLQTAIESPEAKEVKKVAAGLKGAQVKDFLEDLGLFGSYAHGTHVAGIAVDGNPFARLLVARLTFDYHLIPVCPTLERSRKNAAAEQTTVDFFKHNSVRAVNMSWGGNRKEIEQALEKHGAGGTAEERAGLARELYKIERDGLYDALKSAPDILFVAAAGNADNDVEFDEMIPSGFNLPNMLVVGAVDQAGERTDFTSFGKTVQVYANGFEVESCIPGGQRLKLSGTSMAAPGVTNLAAKLLALDPSLKPAQLIELIKNGADKVEGQRPLLLINPQRTVDLLKK